MSDEARAQFLEMTRSIEQAMQKKVKAPSRFVARELLLALGELALAERVGEVEAELAALRVRLEPVAEDWKKALGQEMELSCTEHVQAIDPRYLDHPRYDFDYTVQARQRLEMRFNALDLLGVDADEVLLAQVARADAILEPYLQRKDGQTGSN
ncbi:MAG TPA: hypothetical protein EYQ83_17180 [Acidobacteria bacterium]|nr:hypothetical protein [Acidobacteriota bacterium]